MCKHEVPGCGTIDLRTWAGCVTLLCLSSSLAENGARQTDAQCLKGKIGEILKLVDAESVEEPFGKGLFIHNRYTACTSHMVCWH